MIFNWYRLFNLPEFIATDLVSRKLTMFLENGPGQQDILIVKGNVVSIVYLDTMLPINFADQNPYNRDSYSVFLDANDDVWLGIEVPS